MAFVRASAIRGALKAARPSSNSVARPQVWRQIGRRCYASHGHEAKKAGGDLPWAIGAVAVTVPTCWYLLQSGPDSHGHGDHGHDDAHGKGHGEEHHEDELKDEPDAAAESEDDGKNSENSDSRDEGKDTETPDTSDDEDDSKSDTPKTPQGEKKTVPDSKGANKTRTDSDKGKKQGETDSATGDQAEGTADKTAASKPAGSQNTQSGKQEGLTNTDTKHSIDLEKSSGTSKKGEGTPETSKSKGTVDPKRPQDEPNKKK